VTRACSEGPWTPIHCGTQSNPLRTRDLERRSSAPEPAQATRGPRAPRPGSAGAATGYQSTLSGSNRPGLYRCARHLPANPWHLGSSAGRAGAPRPRSSPPLVGG
jgi:hypothetical protein